MSTLIAVIQIVRDKSEMHNINILIYTCVMFRNIPSKQISR